MSNMNVQKKFCPNIGKVLDADTPLRHDILMMTEFRLTDNKEAVKRAIKMNIPKEPEGYGIRYVPVQEESAKENTTFK